MSVIKQRAIRRLNFGCYSSVGGSSGSEISGCIKFIVVRIGRLEVQTVKSVWLCMCKYMNADVFACAYIRVL